MPAAERSSSTGLKMRTTLSAWTPLNHPLSNNKVFEERRILLAKWFDRWSDSQRRAVLQDLVLSCSAQQLAFLSGSVGRRLPLQAADFTCMLPRSLCVYLFSFLDPRSLCRCARVSWHWKSIVELDQLWMPKCQRLGWCLGFSPTPLEQGVWKRHYIQTVLELRLKSVQQQQQQRQQRQQQRQQEQQQQQRQQQQQHVSPPAISSRDQEVKPDAAPLNRPQGAVHRKKRPPAPPPWRDSDRHPKDTVRFNYLDNLETTGQATRGQVNIRGSAHHRHLHDHTCTAEEGLRRPTASEWNCRLHRAKSLMFLTSNCRPPNPSSSPPPDPRETQYHRPPLVGSTHNLPATPGTTGASLRMSCWGPEILSAPVRSAMLRGAQRSYRSPPSKRLQRFHTSRLSVMQSHSKPLFQVLPWPVPMPYTRERQHSEGQRPHQEEGRTAI